MILHGQVTVVDYLATSFIEFISYRTMLLFRNLRYCWIVPLLQVLYFINSSQQSKVIGEDSDVDDDGLDWNADPDDFLNSIGSLADLLTDFAGDTNGCHFSCKNGATPKRNKNHKPRTNGCGSFGLELDTSAVPGVTKCCDQHDFCYDTCNNDKVKCDEDFRDCLNDVCDNYQKGKDEDDDVLEACYSTAELMYTGTLTLGCKPYKDSQKVACLCEKDEL